MLKNLKNRADGRYWITRQQALLLTPAFVALLLTTLTEIPVLDTGAGSILFWTTAEFGIWSGLGIAAAGTIVITELRRTQARMSALNKAEQNRRAVSALGMAASWDLDIDRLYQRVSQDMRTLIAFDRLTITSATTSGDMRVEFVSGDPAHGPCTGAVLGKSQSEPDGLYPEAAHFYQSRLTTPTPTNSGTITVRSREPGMYGPETLDLLRQVVAQISPGIANAKLFQTSERQLKERTALAEIGQAATSATDAQTILRAVDSSLAGLIGYDHVGAVLVGERVGTARQGKVEYWSNDGLSGLHAGDDIPLDDSLFTENLVVAGNGGSLKCLTDGDSESADANRTWLRVPLTVQEEPVGVLILSAEGRDAFDEASSALVLNVSLQIASAIQNANLTSMLKRQANERRTIAAIGLAANSELKLEAIYQTVGEELGQVMDYDRLAITHLNEVGNQQVVYVMGTEVDGFRVGDEVAPMEFGAFTSDEASLRWAKSSSAIETLQERSGLKSRVSALLGSAPNITGMIHVSSWKASAYNDQDAELLQRIAIQITPALKNAQMIAAERGLWETLEKQNQQLSEANHARKQFLSTVSHELKTPLTIISGFIDLLASPNDDEDEEERQETLGIIRRNADHLNVLINDILDISRMDAGTFKLSPHPFSVTDLVLDLEASFQSLLRTKTQTLNVEMPEDEQWINADKSRISQVITNLVSNASKYSPEETTINLLCRGEDGKLRVTVNDEGMGISEEDQAKLFTAFFRVDNEDTREVSGTGLGLVIAKSITELHGGEISLTSKVGVGTTIEFWIPGLTTREEAEAQVPAEPQFTGSRLWPDGPPEEFGIGAD